MDPVRGHDVHTVCLDGVPVESGLLGALVAAGVWCARPVSTLRRRGKEVEWVVCGTAV